MSGWERSRSLPWDRIPRDVDGLEIDEARERLFRQMHRETVEEELLTQERNLGLASTGENENVSESGSDAVAAADAKKAAAAAAARRYQYSNMQLLRQAAFGATLGSITGGVFGFMDGMRTAGESKMLSKASPVAQTKYLMESTRRSATLFGCMFMGFQVGKYAIRVVGNDPGDVVEIVGSGVATLGTLMYRPTWRAAVPYAFMLMGMDSFQCYMRHTNNTGTT